MTRMAGKDGLNAESEPSARKPGCIMRFFGSSHSGDAVYITSGTVGDYTIACHPKEAELIESPAADDIIVPYVRTDHDHRDQHHH